MVDTRHQHACYTTNRTSLDFQSHRCTDVPSDIGASGTASINHLIGSTGLPLIAGHHRMAQLVMVKHYSRLIDFSTTDKSVAEHHHSTHQHPNTSTLSSAKSQSFATRRNKGEAVTQQLLPDPAPVRWGPGMAMQL